MQESKDRIPYRAMLGEPEYLKMIAANMVNRFGDAVDLVAFGWLVYALTGSGEWLAVVTGVNFLPTVLLQPFTGAWVNYLNKKWVMILCDWGRGLLVLSIAVCFLLKALTPGLLLVITLCNSTLEALRQPCGLSVLPRLIRNPEGLETAMALNQSASRGCELVGMSLAGVLVALFGVGGAVMVDAVTFLLSGLILVTLKPTGKDEPPGKGYLRELRDGVGYYRENRALLVITALCFLINLVSVPIEKLRAAYIGEGLLLAEDALTVGSTALAVGMFLGAIVFPLFGRRLGRRVFVYYGILMGVIYGGLWCAAFLPTAPGKLWAYGALCFLYGAFGAAVDVALNVFLIRNVDSGFLGRIGGIFNALVCASMPLSSFFFAVVLGVLSVVEVYLFTAILAVVSFLALSRAKGMRELR